jgi:hypothetical protein
VYSLTPYTGQPISTFLRKDQIVISHIRKEDLKDLIWYGVSISRRVTLALFFGNWRRIQNKRYRPVGFIGYTNGDNLFQSSILNLDKKIEEVFI